MRSPAPRGRTLQSTFVALTLGLATAADESSALEAGLAVVDATPVVGVPLAGYGKSPRRRFPDLFGQDPWAHYFEPSAGTLDPIRAKVLVLREGPEALVFVSLDLAGAPALLRDAILTAIAAQGFDPDRVLVSATHTHSGPGTLWNSRAWALAGADRFEQSIHDTFVAKVASAVAAAVQGLEASTLFAVSFQASGLQENRRSDHPLNHLDRTANLLLVKSVATSRWTGALVNLAVHGTALRADNFRYSADVPGAIERRFGTRLCEANGGTDCSQEANQVPGLFVNGAEGDVSPSAYGEPGMATLADAFATQALAALPGLRAIQPVLEVRKARVDLGSPFLYLEPCVNSVFPSWFGLTLGFSLAKETWIWSIALGDMRLMTWPGEPTTTLGLALRELGKRSGAAQTWVLGLTNDHLGYATTPAEFAAGGNEACGSLYGPNIGWKIVKEHCRLLGCP